MASSGMCWASVLLDHSLCLHMAWVSYRTAVLENMHLEHGGWPLRAWKQKLPGQLRATPGPGWACLPSLHSIGQAFHPCVLLVKTSIPAFYWSNFSSLCPIGQTFHPYVPLVKPSIPTSYWSKQSQDPPRFKGVEQWTALLGGGCHGH